MSNKQNGVEAADVSIKQQPDAIMKSTGDVERVDSIIEVNNEIDMNYAAELAFMEEEVEVRVEESTDPNAEPVVSVFNNGIAQYFVRGQTQRVKRKFVEVLARAKQTSVSTVEDRNTGNVAIKRNTSIRYPFSMTRDDNPKGYAWLRGILSEPS
jgi:hypothetical protein